MATVTMVKPILAMMSLTGGVLSYMAYKRFSYLASYSKQEKSEEGEANNASNSGKQAKQSATPTRAQMAEFFPPHVMYPANNLQNLFVMPVLFYVVSVIAEVKGVQNVAMFGVTLYSLAWVYVLMRVVHSLIHCTYNKLAHRFIMFFLSTLVLFVMMAQLGMLLL